MTKLRNEIPPQDRWNVEALYQTEHAWKGDYEKLLGSGQPHWPILSSFKGKLKDPQNASSLLDHYFEIQRKLVKLHVYAHLRLDEDLGNDLFKGNFGLISSLYHEFQLESSWIEPELLSLSDAEYHQLFSYPALKEYKFYLEKVGRMRPHTLSPEMEALLALTGKTLETPRRAFTALNNADFVFEPAIDSHGKEHPLTHGTYPAYIRSYDRNLRKTTFQNVHKSYENHINSITELLQGQVQNLVFITKARKFNSCLETALYPNQIDPAVYENLIHSVRRNMQLMHKYIAMRKKHLKLDELHVYDLAVPLVADTEIKMSYSEACEAVIASVAPLGNEYQQALKQGLTHDRWADIYENARKRSGAYSSGCYDSMPYILLNFQGNINDVFTLAHEAGHSMQTFLSNKHQSYINAEYPIFVAEIASTFNEQLLMDHLKSKQAGKKELAYLINYQIEQIRNTIFRQTMFAEFELTIHRLAEEGIPLTPTLLKETYTQLYRDYFGPDLVIDPETAVEWARIPHFYSSFYVYQYATGISAALAFHEKAQKSTETTKRYLEFLSSGGSLYPIDMLKKAGLDMRSSDVVDAAMRHFSQLIDELEKCLK